MAEIPRSPNSSQTPSIAESPINPNLSRPSSISEIPRNPNLTDQLPSFAEIPRNPNLSQLPPNGETTTGSNTVSGSTDCGTSISTTPYSGSSSSCQDCLQESTVAPPHKPPEATPVTVRNGDTAQNKKRKNRWSEEEHKEFLRGLRKHGKGHWTDISMYMGSSRTPAQVASHAQKFFDRQNKKQHSNRSSIHDITTVDEDDDEVAVLDVEQKSP